MPKYNIGQRIYFVNQLHTISGKILKIEYSDEITTFYTVSFGEFSDMLMEDELFETKEDCKPSLLKSLRREKKELEKRLRQVNKAIGAEYNK